MNKSLGEIAYDAWMISEGWPIPALQFGSLSHEQRSSWEISAFAVERKVMEGIDRKQREAADDRRQQREREVAREMFIDRLKGIGMTPQTITALLFDLTRPCATLCAFRAAVDEYSDQMLAIAQHREGVTK